MWSLTGDEADTPARHPLCLRQETIGHGALLIEASRVMVMPYCVSCGNEADGLIERDDGRFQLISGGEMGPFMAGHAYVLVEKRLSKFLTDVEVEGLQALPATILRRQASL